jgi:lipopolysaccharide biosynthesis protein
MPLAKKTAFVIAHFHQNGRVALNTHALVEEMAKLTDSVVFISTNINAVEATQLKKNAIVIQRENIGYDFWSYKLGIEHLGDLSQFERIVVCNTSFIALDPSFLVKSFTGPVEEIGLLGLSRNGDMGDHIQSYWISFEGTQLLNSPEFFGWWSSLMPLNDRADNINKYEVGLSSYFSKHGYSLRTLFQATPNHLLIMLARAISGGSVIVRLENNLDLKNKLQIVPLDLAYALGLNPTVYGWDFLLDHLKILKIEQIKFNYGNQFMDAKISALSQNNITLIKDATL